ncbi:MAG TPA: hypothetical protein VNH18_15915, partial [Bryobacteraceae bacterium]|nr:hypothetical protein [Bryobacteraceae bacterium]
MKITPNLLEAYLKCPTKCWLRSAGEQITDRTWAQYTRAEDESYRAAAIDLMFSGTDESECLRSPDPDRLK